MSNRKTCFYAVLLFVITACTKKDLTPVLSNDQSNAKTTSPTQIFGLLIADGEITETKNKMAVAETKLVRVPIFLSENTFSRTIDNYLADGYSVQINLNWANTATGAVAFPSDTNVLRKQARAFFKYYAQYKKQIPLIVVENEWDNTNYHSGTIEDYLNELTVITRLAHKHEFKVTDAGITSAALQRWTYSQLTGAEAAQWRQTYFVGLNNDYDELVNTVNSYVNGVKQQDIDYINVHWYNTNRCSNGFKTATNIYMEACNKNELVCNEFGIRTNSPDLFDATVNEIKGNAIYAFAYSGIDIATGKAIKLSDEMLTMLQPQ